MIIVNDYHCSQSTIILTVCLSIFANFIGQLLPFKYFQMKIYDSHRIFDQTTSSQKTAIENSVLSKLWPSKNCNFVLRQNELKTDQYLIELISINFFISVQSQTIEFY